MARAVIFDRDGVINRLVWHEGRYTSPWTTNEFKVYSGVKEAIASLKKKGYIILVATNQPGLAYGEVSREAYASMCQQVFELGVCEIFTCDHPLDSTCDCRKPKPGLLLNAARKYDLSLRESYFVGDNESDMQAAAAAGCKGILLRTLLNVDTQAAHEIGMLGLLPAVIPNVPRTPARQ